MTTDGSGIAVQAPRNGNGWTEKFDGSIDEMSLWTEALSAEEILVLYQNKSLQDLPTITTGTATTTLEMEDSSGLHEISGQFTTATI